MPIARTLCFDVYGTLVNPIRLPGRLRQQVGESADQVSAIWRQKQLEYTFRLTAMEWYRDFEWVTRRALMFAVRSVGGDLSPEQLQSAMESYAEMDAFPDVPAGLDRLAADGHRLTVLSNGTPAMLDAVLRWAGLAVRLQAVISANEVRAFKPAPRVYEHAAARLTTPIGELMLVSSNAFDVIGARNAGMETAWIRRDGAVFDEFDIAPGLVAGGLEELADSLRG
jgi:2-haloacid dehalogenase